MARKKKIEDVNLNPDPTNAPASEPTNTPPVLPEEGALPLPEGLQDTPQKSGPVAEVVSEPPQRLPAGLSLDEPPVRVSTVAKAQTPEHASVRLRALMDLDFSPTCGKFDFADAVGRNPQTGASVRGKFKNGFVYNVPNYVAGMIVERGWGMRV